MNNKESSVGANSEPPHDKDGEKELSLPGRALNKLHNVQRASAIPSLPEYFPGANERVRSVEIERGDQALEEMYDGPRDSFLDEGVIVVHLPEEGPGSPSK